MLGITKTYLYNVDPLKPHFYIVKLGFTGVYIIFLISAQNIDCGYSLEPPRRGGSNEYPQSMFLSRNMENIRIFIWKLSGFLVVKLSIYLNRHVFVMVCMWATEWENILTCSNNKGADQPAYPRSLICSIVFAAWILQYQYSVNLKVQHLFRSMLLGRSVCALPGHKPRIGFLLDVA